LARTMVSGQALVRGRNFRDEIAHQDLVRQRLDEHRTRLQPREMLVEPLPNKVLVRDLVTEIAAPDERLP